ncbi:hypothetical protein T4E_4650 [Trichinella pseudospiralis]|uniref:Uncharacterized protein n=1 Tax=Trichinella pseudospiralis TaxID=6337 RepID=A0A0V0YJG8_TRIPS|nr:hypothetical protein T4E_4650 [Trichinella pseudospiralis]
MASIRATMTMTVGQNRMDNQERAENFDPNRPNLNFNAIKRIKYKEDEAAAAAAAEEEEEEEEEDTFMVMVQ